MKNPREGHPLIPHPQDHFEREILEHRPEVYGLPPREDVKMVYSVPVRGEFHNGQFLRMLEGFFAQRLHADTSFEVHVTLNDLRGDRLIESIAIRNLLATIIAFPELSQEARTQAIAEHDDVLVRHFLKRYAEHTDRVRFVFIDTTTIPFSHNIHSSRGLIDFVGAIRTLGADVAYARFADRLDIPISLFDADTFPADNQTVQEMITLFAKNPDVYFCFPFTIPQQRGVDDDFTTHVGDIPLDYFSGHYYQSPQIVFRLSVYAQFERIAQNENFHYEDVATAHRILYMCGDFQDGILAQRGVHYPVVMTSKRLDGFCDGLRRRHFQNGLQLDTFYASVDAFSHTVSRHIERFEKSTTEVQMYAAVAREKYENMFRGQIRMNRLVVRAFCDAITERLVMLDTRGDLFIREHALLRKKFGKALLHFLRMNKVLAQEILASLDDQKMLAYACGKVADYPFAPEYQPTYFQQVLREYCGDMVPFSKISAEVEQREESMHDFFMHRKSDVRTSYFYGMLVELLVAGSVFKTFAEPRTHRKNVEHYRSSSSLFDYFWGVPSRNPVVPSEKFTERIDAVRARAQGAPLPKRSFAEMILTQLGLPFLDAFVEREKKD